MFKGTKGDWSVVEGNKIISGKITIADTWYYNKSFSKAKKDAQLISADPDLLEVANKAFDLFDKLQMPTESEINELKVFLKQAINKALGVKEVTNV